MKAVSGVVCAVLLHSGIGSTVERNFCFIFADIRSCCVWLLLYGRCFSLVFVSFVFIFVFFSFKCVSYYYLYLNIFYFLKPWVHEISQVIDRLFWNSSFCSLFFWGALFVVVVCYSFVDFCYYIYELDMVSS